MGRWAREGWEGERRNRKMVGGGEGWNTTVLYVSKLPLAAVVIPADAARTAAIFMFEGCERYLRW